MIVIQRAARPIVKAAGIEFKRHLSTQLIVSATQSCESLLERYDRSSWLLARYIPEPARNTFLAIRSFNIEISKIMNSSHNVSEEVRGATGGLSTASIKLDFWASLINNIFSNYEKDLLTGEPVGILLQEALMKEQIMDPQRFLTAIQSRKLFLENPSFPNIDAICSYGEGTYSQYNYLIQSVLLSDSISPTSRILLEQYPEIQSNVVDIAAHIGQATSVATFLLGFQYYTSSMGQILLPIDLMTEQNLSQESVIRLNMGKLAESESKDTREKLREVVFQTATRANDHILAARFKLTKVQDRIKEISKDSNTDPRISKVCHRWRKNISDAIYIPYIVVHPTTLFLGRLEKADFDLFDPSLQTKEYRLAWKSFWSYYRRTI